MTRFQNLQQVPFNLDSEQVKWVSDKVSQMTLEEKAAQVFVLLLLGERDEDFDIIKKVKPGGFTRFFSPDLGWEMEKMTELFNELPIPPLVSADLEGSRQSFDFGTQVPNQLGLAAANDTELTRHCASILAKEGKQLGITWSFTPVIDINAAFRSAIVGTRSYGSQVDRIEQHALAHIDGLQSNGVAATVKHWPGEGYDDRDQHLVTTTNPLSVEEWHETFGRLYSSMFEAGVMSVMSAHIAFPAYMRQCHPDIGMEAYKPASISHEITTRLLRDELSFNGIVVSDATEMAGLGSWITHEEAPAQVLAAGSDVILFSLDPERDIASVVSAVQNGSLTQERLDDAVSRILALKIKQGLIDGNVTPKKTPAFKNPDDVAAGHKALTQSITLVKDVQNTLPISLEKHKRVLIISTGIPHPLKPEPITFDFPDMMRNKGFEVTVYEKNVTSLDWSQYDLVVYLLGDESLLTKSRIYLDWANIMGGIGRTLERPWHYVPTVMVSFGHPYYLYDAPRVPTYINAYSTLPEVQGIVLEALMGEIDFNGDSPVDPFCGMEDTRF